MKYILAVLVFILGFLSRKVLDIIYSKICTEIKKCKLKKQIAKINKNEHSVILPIASGFPNFNENLHKISLTPHKFFLSLPQSYKDKLDIDKEQFSDNDIIDIEIESIYYSKEQVMQYINVARNNIANSFFKRSDGMYFNSKLYGIYYADGFSRTSDESEKPILTIKMYETDYYTHRIMADVLKQLQPNLDHITGVDLNEKYPLFRTSLGLSIVVVLSSTNQIIMTKRSTSAAYSEGRNWIYVSATETFSITDYDAYLGAPSIDLCIKRGLFEELGITPADYSDNKIMIHDMFFEKNFFQDGITATVILNNNVSFLDISKARAKDRQLEVNELFLINNDSITIEKYIKNEKENMRAQTIFALQSHMIRL